MSVAPIGVDTDTHWANGVPRLLTPQAYEREAAAFAVPIAPIEPPQRVMPS